MFQLQEVAKEYSLTISLRKTKTKAFKGKYPMRTKAVSYTHLDVYKRQLLHHIQFYRLLCTAEILETAHLF